MDNKELAPDKQYECYFKNGGYEFPGNLIVELTNCCNLSCSMCPRHYMESHPGYMSFELFKSIVGQIKEHPETVIIPFFRGESFLHPDFLRMMEYLKKNTSNRVVFATNGMLLNRELAKEIINLEIDFISFSLDTINKTRYEKMRRGAKYDTVVENIDSFLMLKESSGQAKPEVQISSVETEKTKDEVEQFVREWLPRVDRVRIYKEHSAGGQFGRLKTPLNDTQRKPCIKPITEMAIYWDGTVGLCNHDWIPKAFLGDANKSLLKDIWRGKRYEEVRRQHLENRIDSILTCFNCDYWQMAYLPKKMFDNHFKNLLSKQSYNITISNR